MPTGKIYLLWRLQKIKRKMEGSIQHATINQIASLRFRVLVRKEEYKERNVVAVLELQAQLEHGLPQKLQSVIQSTIRNNVLDVGCLTLLSLSLSLLA